MFTVFPHSYYYAQEYTHGITQFTSGLIYKGESGAINEAMSDIFGAMVDWENGASEKEIRQIGEDVYVENGKAMKSMKRPRGFYCFSNFTLKELCRDYYPDRYIGTGECNLVLSVL